MTTEYVFPYSGNAVISNALTGLGGSDYVPDYVGWSVGAFTATRDLQYLPNEEVAARTQGILTLEDNPNPDDTLVCTATLTANGNKTIYGAGWFTSADYLFGVASFSGIPIEDTQEMVFVWKLQGK